MGFTAPRCAVIKISATAAADNFGWLGAESAARHVRFLAAPDNSRWWSIKLTAPSNWDHIMLQYSTLDDVRHSVSFYLFNGGSIVPQNWGCKLCNAQVSTTPPGNLRGYQIDFKKLVTLFYLCYGPMLYKMHIVLLLCI